METSKLTSWLANFTGMLTMLVGPMGRTDGVPMVCTGPQVSGIIAASLVSGLAAFPGAENIGVSSEYLWASSRSNALRAVSLGSAAGWASRIPADRRHNTRLYMTLL